MTRATNPYLNLPRRSYAQAVAETAQLRGNRNMPKTASWVIVRKSTGAAVFETFNAKVAAAINQAEYRAVPILEYLQTLNAQIRANT